MGRGTGSRVDTFEWVLQSGGENDSAFPGWDQRSRVEG
jgi:hypothetical protein